MALERRKEAGKYLAVLYISFTLTILKTIFLTPVFLTYIQPRLYGAWLATGDVIAALGLLEFGMARVLIQRIASALGRNDTQALSELIGSGLCIFAVVSILPFTVGLAAAPFLPGFVHIEGPEARTLSVAFITAAAAASLMLASNAIAAVLLGLQAQVKASIVGVLGLTLGIVATVSLLWTGHGLNSIPLGNVVHAVVGLMGGISVAVLTLRRRIPEFRLRLSRSLLISLLRDTGVLFAGTALFTVATRSQNPLIAHLYDPGLCNVYAFTFLIQSTLAGLVVYVSHALLPGLAHLVGESGGRKAGKVVTSLIKVTLMFAGLLMGGVYFLNEEFVRLWVGAQYYGGTVLNGLACANGLCFAVFAGLQNVVLSYGAFGVVTRGNVLKAVIHLALMVPMALWWGLQGMAVASVLSLLLSVFLVQCPFLALSTANGFRSLLTPLYPPALMVAVPFLIGYAFKSAYSPLGVIGFIFAGTLYTVIILVFYCLADREARRAVLETVPSYCAGYFRR